MGQKSNLEGVFNLHLNTLTQLFDTIGKDEVEYGLSYDYRTKTEWSNIDKYQEILKYFKEKVTER